MYGINNTLMIKRNITYITSYEISLKLKLFR